MPNIIWRKNCFFFFLHEVSLCVRFWLFCVHKYIVIPNATRAIIQFIGWCYQLLESKSNNKDKKL